MQNTRRFMLGLAAVFVLACTAGTAHAEKPFIIVQSTTSTQDTGFFDYLLPKFSDKTGIEVRVVAVGGH
jgi:tungstate transport system substrate-binding protein